ncbi:hypothetical protein ALT721_2120007 [Alteromonas alvinellae]
MSLNVVWCIFAYDEDSKRKRTTEILLEVTRLAEISPAVLHPTQSGQI